MTKSVSFLKTAEEKVAETHEGPSLEEARASGKLDPRDVTGMPGAPDGYRYDPEYVARNRAQELLSVEVKMTESPMGRFQFDQKALKESPFAYRWISEVRRQKSPSDIDTWTPVTDLEEAKRICVHKMVRQEADGKVVNGDLFLARRPREVSERRAAMHFQRAMRMQGAAARGEMNPLGKDGKPISGPTFAQLHSRYKSPGDKGVLFTGDLKDDRE